MGGTIIGKKWLVGGEIMVSAGGFIEVAGVTVDGVYHVTFASCNHGRLLGVNVVQ